MISFDHPIALLALIPLLAVTLFAWRYAFTNLNPPRMRLALAVRLTILAALCLALAGTGLRLPQSRQAVVFVADLSASDYGQRSATQALINAAESGRPDSGASGVISVGREPVVEQPVTQPNAFDGFQAVVDRNYTNLGGGLDLANAILPPGYQRRVVVVSDGQQNVGDALASARLLRSQGVRVDVAPVRVPGGAEVLVDRIAIPPQLRPRESFALTIDLRSTVRTTTALTILRDRTTIGTRQETVRPGDNRFVFQQTPLPPGFHTYQVEIAPARDTQPENNQGSAFTSVLGSANVLVIADQPTEAASVLASLKSTGVTADLRTPARVTPELGFLQRYAAVVIVDTAADALGPALMAQLVPYVRDLGHGLVLIGGQNAYNMGGYGRTPLEQVLPVSMDLPKRRALPTTAVVLIIESLEEDTQINISKEAGKGLINLLTPQDQVAVNDAPFDSSSGWVVPLQHVTNRAAINAAIDRMAPGDPESYVPALQSAYNTLRRSTARIKHIIVLGDGDAEDSSYQQLIQGIRAGGITVSTVSTNGLGRNNFQTMQDIARWGGGRNYLADDPSKIPQIFLHETRTVARLGIVTGKFFPQALSANPMLRDLRTVAPLYGYVATTPKPAGEMVLASNKLDPILAGWQFGLGRSVAWTSDAAGLWTRDWLRVPGANRFWANLVSWVLPAAGSGQLFINTVSSQGRGRISVSTPASLGSGASVTARVLDPQLGATTVQLQPSAPGQFAGSFQESAQGAYFVSVVARGGGHALAGQAGMDVPYSAEYRAIGVNLPFLRTLAAAGGGSVIAGPQDAWRDNLSAVLAQYDLTVWLLLLALLLIPVDISVRRLIVSRRELAALLDALPGRRGRPQTAEPALAPLRALRRRRSERAGSVPGEEAAINLGRGAVPSVHAPRWGVRSPAGSHPADVSTATSSDETTAAKLLAARRRKQ